GGGGGGPGGGGGGGAVGGGRRGPVPRPLLASGAGRPRRYYAAAVPLAGMLRPAGRAVFLVMLRTYRGLLDEIERRDYDVFRERVRLSRLRKLWLAARALPARWGWI